METDMPFSRWWYGQIIFWRSIWRMALHPEDPGSRDRDYYGLTTFDQEGDVFLGLVCRTSRGELRISVLEDDDDEKLRARAEVARSIAEMGDAFHEMWESWRNDQADMRQKNSEEIRALVVDKVTLYNYDDPAVGELYFKGKWPSDSWFCGYDHDQKRFYDLHQER